jgi:[FeFe] hydrogenase H-cluster maturation GTPase HydF
MNETPKANRLHIGLFGRANTGKSSFLNLLAGQDVSITSPVAGTTTDVVEKTMELLPLGPVVFHDTAGLDDASPLAGRRGERTHRAFERVDIGLLITEAGRWGSWEERVVEDAERRKLPLIAVVNKSDEAEPAAPFLAQVRARVPRVMVCSSLDAPRREATVDALRKHLIDACPEDFLSPPPVVGDLLPPGGLAVLVVPIDLQAPKGRLILPQVQTIRDALDHDAAALIVKEREYADVLGRLKRAPDLVVCDSQIVLKMIADTPAGIPCTTFSILFSRCKGDLVEAARGAAAIERLRAGDRVLIAEACSHHPAEDDIGRVKIPRWLSRYAGVELQADVCSGKDYPDDLKRYSLILHCGGCMGTRREMLARIQRARLEGIPITNYGVAISMMHGVAERVLSPFPAALAAFREARNRFRAEA